MYHQHARQWVIVEIVTIDFNNERPHSGKYPVIFDIWQRNWFGIAPFFSFLEDIRKALYTTNAIEFTNRQIRKIIKNKGVFPDDKSIQKIIFLVLPNASKKWTIPIKNWALS